MAANERRNARMIRWVLVLALLSCSDARKHKLTLKDDDRKTVSLSTFGFLTGGTLTVNVTLSGVSAEDAKRNTTLFGFTLDKTMSPGLSRYMEEMQNKCILNKSDRENKNNEDKKDNVESVFFRFDFQNKRLNFERVGSSLQKLILTNITRKVFQIQHHLHRRSAHAGETKLNEVYPLANHRSVREARSRREALDSVPPGNAATSKKASSTARPATSVSSSPVAGTAAPSSKTSAAATPSPSGNVPISSNSSHTSSETSENNDAAPLLTYTDVKDLGGGTYQTYFLVFIQREAEEGLYNLYFHNCLSYLTVSNPSTSIISLSLDIVEDNNGNYLTAGEMPVPALYFTFSMLFFIAGVAWLSVLRKSKEDVFKIHYLMLSVIFMKSLACLFHGVNMYFIEINGVHEEAWAILWYIVYLDIEDHCLVAVVPYLIIVGEWLMGRL